MLRAHSYLVPSLFFFQSYADNRDLHSFPTRRSSDLPGLSPVCARALDAMVNAGPQTVRQVKSTGRTRDRKSTRLNSSHRCISYAVFCLKKKKKQKSTDANNKISRKGSG